MAKTPKHVERWHLKYVNRWRKWQTPVLAAILVLGTLLAILLALSPPVKVYKLAYIGRKGESQYNRFNKEALRYYLAQLNSKLRGARFELETYSLFKTDERNNITGNYYADSREFYWKEAAMRPDVVAVIDDTWRSNIATAAGAIKDQNMPIPVFNINSDKADTDFGNNTVFLGHDDLAASTIIDLSREISQDGQVVFISEEDYGYQKDKFVKEIDRVDKTKQIKCKKLFVHGGDPDVKNDEPRHLFESLDEAIAAKRAETKNDQELITVVLNTHSKWGNQIINHLDTTYNNIQILGPSYVILKETYLENFKEFGTNGKTNSLIILTNPIDADEPYADSTKINKIIGAKVHEENQQLFTKRCMDAISLVRGAVTDEEKTAKFGLSLKSEISKQTFLDFFHERLAGNKYLSNMGSYNEVYEFDKDLLLKDERIFEKIIPGLSFPYPLQLNQYNTPVYNINFGFNLINVTKVDLENRVFHADFFYTLKYDKRYSDEHAGSSDKDEEVNKHIVFINEINPGSVKAQKITEGYIPEVDLNYLVFKKSGDFSMEADFSKYPFDQQQLNIELESDNLSNDVLISFDKKTFDRNTLFANILKFDQWSLDKENMKVEPNKWPLVIADAKTLPLNSKTFKIITPITRAWPGPAIKLMVPLFIIGIVIISLLFIKDGSFKNIGSVCVVTFLSFVTYGVAYAQNTPKTNKFTPADVIFYSTLIILFIVFVKMIFCSSFWEDHHARKNGEHLPGTESAFSEADRTNSYYISKWLKEKYIGIGLTVMIIYVMINIVTFVYAYSG